MYTNCYFSILDEEQLNKYLLDTLQNKMSKKNKYF